MMIVCIFEMVARKEEIKRQRDQRADTLFDTELCESTDKITTSVKLRHVAPDTMDQRITLQTRTQQGGWGRLLPRKEKNPILF